MEMEKVMKTRDELLKEIQTEHAAWRSLVDEVGEDRMDEPGPMGEWSFKDLAAHLTFWQDRMILHIKTGTEPPAPWPAELADENDEDSWEAINAWIREQHHERSARDVLADADRSYERFAALIAAMPEDNLLTPGHYDAMGDKALIEANFFEHFHDEHEPAVREWLATR